MSFVSYAQNFEDVILWRTLKHVENGFYIDIGAGWPEADSVTKAFYDRGWRGINVEPDPACYCQLCVNRPNDVNLCVAVGDVSGTAQINIISVTGLSTLDSGIAKEHESKGRLVSRVPVTTTTLNAIWKEHVGARDVHFLKIDVEGFEEKVLRGNAWSHQRPWVVVVEATRPESKIASHQDWEPVLSSAGYTFAYADGLNRFYVAKERAELLSAFAYPPNVFDDYKLHKQHEAELRVHAAENRAHVAENRAHVAENYLNAILQSRSWRMTKPLRWLQALAEQITRRKL